jgi:hypothetical protein
MNLLVEIGVGLTAFGLFFMMMGVLMLFDGGLMAIGNVIINIKPFEILKLNEPRIRYCSCAELQRLLDLEVLLYSFLEEKSYQVPFVFLVVYF